jgi:hypothetical protein
VLGVGLATAGSAGAADPNGFVTAYGPDLRVREVTVRVAPNVFGKPQDAAARSYLQKRATPEQKAAFQARSPGTAPDAAGERMAEFLASSLLDRRLNTGAEGPLRVLVDVTGFRMRSSFPLPGSEPLPIGDAKLDFTVRIEDAGTGRELARAQIVDCIVATSDMEQAKTLAGLRYAPAGLDIQFRMLAGSMNAVSRYVEVVLEQPMLPTGSERLNSFALANGALITDDLRHPLIRLTVQPKP